MADWNLASNILEGYPHPVWLAEADEEWYVTSAALYEYRWSADALGWKADNNILEGYPHLFYRELTPPYHLPLFTGVSINVTEGFAGISGGLSVTISGLKYIVPGDVLAFTIKDSSGEIFYSGETILELEGEMAAVIHMIPDVLALALDTGEYIITAAISRGDEEIGTSLSTGYTVYPLPEVTVHSVSPATVQKPVKASNNELTLTYEIIGTKIEQITNTFDIGGFTTSETVKSSELLKVNATVLTARIYDASVVFTVTDPSFKLVSFKFLFGNYTTVDEVDYRIDGTTVMKGNYPMSGWVEYVAPSPVALAPGSHTIRLYNSPSYWYLYSTTTKPTAPGMEFTSATLYAMEIVYVISTSSVSGERTVTLMLDDTAEAGCYPVAVESAATLAGYGVYTFNKTTGDMLEVLAGAAPEPEIGGVTLDMVGRYESCETDVTVFVSGLENILDGDALTVKLMNGSVVCYKQTGTLVEGAATYTHIIPASAFIGLAVGSYAVTTVVARDDFVKDASTDYTVVATPGVSFVSITPDTVQLPLSVPLTLTAAWKATGTGIDNIQGIVSLVGTAYTANVNTASLNLSAALMNVTALDAGVYSLAGVFSVTSNAYGVVTSNINPSDILEVLAAVPEPKIGGIAINPTERYVGSEIDVSIEISGLQDIINGDNLYIRLCQGNAVFYDHSESLKIDAFECSHIIQQSYFTGLGAGNYAIKAAIKRDSFTTCEVEAVYRAVLMPTVKFISIKPEKIQLPIVSPLSIGISLVVDGEGVNEVTGAISLSETEYSSVVGTAEANINVTISNVTDLIAKVYYVVVMLTVKSYLYGTATIHEIYNDVLTVEEALLTGAVIETMVLSVPGRYMNNEVDNEVTVTVSHLDDVWDNDKIIFTFYKDNEEYFENLVTLNYYQGTYSITIPASAIIGLPIGEYFIKAAIMRGNWVMSEKVITYQVVITPLVSLAGVSQEYINLPIFVPLNIIANFILYGENISKITGEVDFNGLSYTNSANMGLVPATGITPMSISPSATTVTSLSIAIRNIYEVPSGLYSFDTKFVVESILYGKVEITAKFVNIITVTQLITKGVETKYIYDLILCRSNRQEIAFIECFDVVYNPMFLEYNKLSFSIYREIVTEDGTKVLNPIWGKVLSDYQVLLHIRINDLIVYTEYFVVENPSLSYDGLDQLTFQAYSYEKVFLSNGNLSGFKDSVKRLYDVTNSIGSDKLPHGFLNYILKMKWYNCWTLRHVDGSVLERERVLSFTGNNMKYVIDTLEESFNCVFVFDNVNMTLDIYERSIGMLGNNRGLVIADDNYMTTINYQEDTTGIKTRITVFGKNSGVISRYNPTGQLYVDDFSYYTNLQYMSQGLIDALNDYTAFVASKDGVWTGYVTRLDDNDTSVQPLIDTLRQELAWENHFTDEQIKELAPFIKEDTVTINTISDGKELYKYALRHIKTKAFVPIQISVDIPDVFALEEHCKEWLKFRIGDFVNIYRKEYALEYTEMRLISYEHNPIKNTLRLEFSNKDELITMQWLNNMFFYQLENMQTQYGNERDWYVEMPEFRVDDPKLIDIVQNIVDNSVTEITNNVLEEVDNRVFNSITEVFETNVLSTETAHILNAWIRYLCVDMLETNFEALDLRLPPPTNNTRYYIRIQGIKMEHIEALLSPFETEDYKTPFGDQIYWTSINDHPQAYKYFTITDPMSVHPGRVLLNPLPAGTTENPPGYTPEYRPMTDADIENLRDMFRVKVRKTISSAVKKSDAFESTIVGGKTTMIPKVIWGAGDPAGNGKGFQYKDLNSFNFTYTLQTNAGKTPAGTEIGISIRDEGCFYFDVDENEWRPIGSGNFDESVILKLVEEVIKKEINFTGSQIILDHLPSQAEIDNFPLQTEVLVYDPNNPFIPR